MTLGGKVGRGSGAGKEEGFVLLWSGGAAGEGRGREGGGTEQRQHLVDAGEEERPGALRGERGTRTVSDEPFEARTVFALDANGGVPWAELIFGAFLLLGLFNPVTAGVATLIVLSILVAWLGMGNLLPRHMLMIHRAKESQSVVSSSTNSTKQVADSRRTFRNRSKLSRGEAASRA